MAGAPEFRMQLGKLLKGLEDKTDTVARNIASIMAENIIVGGQFSPGTPVDTGYARSSWYPALNGNPLATGLDQNAAFRAQSMLQKGKAGDMFEIWTNTQYMPSLEYGHSRQAPNGMVRHTMKSAQAIAREAIRQL